LIAEELRSRDIQRLKKRLEREGGGRRGRSQEFSPNINSTVLSYLLSLSLCLSIQNNERTAGYFPRRPLWKILLCIACSGFSFSSGYYPYYPFS
jgi:hypothetical protein